MEIRIANDAIRSDWIAIHDGQDTAGSLQTSIDRAKARSTCGDHPFVDGNKRTAFIVALAFLEVNGVTLTLGKAWVANMEGVAAGAIGRDELVALLTREMPNDDPVAVEP